MTEDRSCFKCGWNQIGTITLLGTCWGYLPEQGKPMEIQAHKRGDGKYIADFGCKKWRPDKVDFKELEKTLKPCGGLEMEDL